MYVVSGTHVLCVVYNQDMQNSIPSSVSNTSSLEAEYKCFTNT